VSGSPFQSARQSASKNITTNKRATAGYKKPGAQPVAANVPTGPSNAVQWTPQLGQEFKKHYDSGFEEKGSKKCVKTVFSLFSNGSKTLAQPQLYRLLEVCGMPPKDFSAATSFMEFDRNKTSKIEQSELTKGHQALPAFHAGLSHLLPSTPSYWPLLSSW